MKPLAHPLSKLAVAVGVVTMAAPAFSQSVLEEIVVVAQKREQNLQEVPIAISAFTGAQMDAWGSPRALTLPPSLPACIYRATWRGRTPSSRSGASPE